MFCVVLQVEIVKPVEKKTPEEKRLDDKYLNQFKGVKEIKKCTFEEKVNFFCPYYAADSVPPYPSKDKVKNYSECCGEKCCTKDEKEKFEEKKNSKPGWCWDWLSS